MTNLAYFKGYPREEYYLALEDAIAKYLANPPDAVKEIIGNQESRARYENPRYNPLAFDSNEPITLDDLSAKFFTCPTDITAENFREGLREYQLKNPEGGEISFDSI